MAGRLFITSCGSFDNPVSHFRTALLTVAIALAVVLCALLLTLPPEYHVMMIDIWLPETPPPQGAMKRPLHQLVIDKDGRMALDGARVANHVELKRIVDAEQMEYPVPDLRVVPGPALRYGDFIDVVYVVKRAHVYRVCFDWAPREQHPDLLAGARKNCAILPPRI